MTIVLDREIHEPIIIVGFPGFGLVGTITTEFLNEHLEMKQVGHIFLPELPAIAAVHKSKLLHPIALFYDEVHNILIVHGIVMPQQTEWKIADAIGELAKKVTAKRIYTIEGVAAGKQEESVSYYANYDAKISLTSLEEGIVLGVTSALMLRVQDVELMALFAMTSSQLPDSHAAAEVVKVFDVLLGLDVDYQPLHEAAAMFEEKVRGIMMQSQEAVGEQQKKVLSYVG